MFGNRSLRVKMVKDENVYDEPTDYNELIETISKNVFAGILIYIGADTIRKSVIYAVSAKI